MYTNYRPGDRVMQSFPVSTAGALSVGRVLAVHARGVTVVWPTCQAFETYRDVTPVNPRADDYLPPVLRARS